MTAQQKKKKRTTTLLISGLVILLIGIITYHYLKKPPKTETKIQTSEKKVSQLQNQLSQIKKDLNKPENTNQKTKFLPWLTTIKNKLNNLSQQNSQEQEKVIKNLEQEIKEINKDLGIKDNSKPSPNQNKLTKYICAKISDNAFKYRFTVNNDKQNCQGFDDVSYSDFINFLRMPQHPQYKEFFPVFQEALKDANSKFPAYFWKCPPVSKNTLDRPFEFVVIKSDTLNNIEQDYSSFQEHFRKSNDNQVVSFFSPSGNVLISPIPKGTADYKNISQFTKNAPEEQQQALWKEVANKLMEELKKNANTPRWLNTEGTGVYYLHVRIDKTNKFYSNYKEYGNFGE